MTNSVIAISLVGIIMYKIRQQQNLTDRFLRNLRTRYLEFVILISITKPLTWWLTRMPMEPVAHPDGETIFAVATIFPTKRHEWVLIPLAFGGLFFL